MGAQSTINSQDLLNRASSLFGLLRKNVAEADAMRRLPDENIDALQQADLLKVWVPRRYGGFEAPIQTQINLSAEIARACPSTGWVFANLTTLSAIACLLSQKAQDEIFGADGNALVCGVLLPGGTASPSATKTTDGYRVSGEWPFASGSLHATWTGLGVPIIENGQMVDLALMLFPRADLEIRDTWFTVGMRGTGSNTFVAHDVFVPTHRTLPLMGPSGAIEGSTLTEHRSESLYRVPLGALLRLGLSGPALGIARAAQEAFLEGPSKRSIPYTTYQSRSEAPSIQIALANADTKREIAALLVQRAAAEAQRFAVDGDFPDLRTRVRIANDTAYAMNLAKESLDLLIAATGSSSMAESSFLQYSFRDLSTVVLHGIFRPTMTLEMYGRVLCGLSPGISTIF